MRLTKIYTKIGDSGKTMLANGEKIPKDEARIASYGDVDELNSHCGLLKDLVIMHLNEDEAAELVEKIQVIQNELFDIGGELATPSDCLNTDLQQVITEESTKRLEDEIDQMNSKLEPLANFILPGGHICNSQCHICRTVCRRAERKVVAFQRDNEVRSIIQIYLNRLSDWFFVASRMISLTTDAPENLWKQNKKKVES